MIHWLYDLGFFLFGIFSLPHFLGRLRQEKDPRRLLRERFGLPSPEVLSRFEGKRPLWIHAVSVGEVLAVEKFLELIRERRPDLSVLLTTVTPAGQQMARKWEAAHLGPSARPAEGLRSAPPGRGGAPLGVAYFPFDFRFSVRRFFEAFQPAALILVETEIWPNVIEEARRRKVPVCVVNGRISERSFRAFRQFSAIFSPLLRGVDLFLVQTEKDRDRLVGLGVDSEKVKVTGNMKLDAIPQNGRWEEECAGLRERWGFAITDRILIGGSTHSGEEETLFRALRNLRGEGYPVKLLLAPRHIERSRKILELAKKQGLEAVLATNRSAAPSLPSPFEVLILDQLGELRNLYAIADVVFMGGSLVRHGGQNPIEPARFARAILHGPWVFNFEAIYRHLDEAGASLKVETEEELVFVLKRILNQEQEKKQLGNRAREVLQKLQGASERNLNWMDQFFMMGTMKYEKLCQG